MDIDMSTTIDLTFVPPDVCNELIHLNDNLGNDTQLRQCLQDQYLDQLEESEKIFSQWFDETSKKLVEDIGDFVDKSLKPIGESLFDNEHRGNLFHPATVVLGMQATDHQFLLDCIVKYLEDKHKTLQIVRINKELSVASKRNETSNILAQKRVAQELLIMIEGAETMDILYAEFLCTSLNNMVRNCLDKKVIVLFFSAGKYISLAQLLPMDVCQSMRRMTTIGREVTAIKTIGDFLQKNLINMANIRFKLSSKVVEVIENEFLMSNATIQNIKHIYQYGLNEHFSRIESLLLQPKKEVMKLCNSSQTFIDKLRDLKSMKSINGVNWKNPKSFSEFCFEKIEFLLNYHEFVCDQLDCYLILLKDQFGENFPTQINDLYQELMEYDDMGQSTLVVDSITKLKSYSNTGIIKRIDKCMDISPKSSLKLEDVRSIISRYRPKLENNEDCKKIVSDLIHKLLKHAQVLKNPLGMPLNEAVYFTDEKLVYQRTLQAKRTDSIKHYTDTSTHFGLLYNIIQDSMEEISLTDLFNDFLQATEEAKQPPSKKPRLSTARRVAAQSKKQNSINSKSVRVANDVHDNESSLKALFIDLISCMEYHGLLKSDIRRSRKGVVRRSVWLR